MIIQWNFRKLPCTMHPSRNPKDLASCGVYHDLSWCVLSLMMTHSRYWSESTIYSHFLVLVRMCWKKSIYKVPYITHTLEDPNTKLKRNYVPSLFFASIFFAITTLTCTTLERSLHVPIIQRLRLA